MADVDVVDLNVTEPDVTELDVDGLEQRADHSWVEVCTADHLLAGRGAAALVAGRQVALFRVSGPQGDEVLAIGNLDPTAGNAPVLSRGLVGSRTRDGQHRDVVFSPLYKNAFDLRTGECLDQPGTAVAAYPTLVVDGRVRVCPVPAGSAAPAGLSLAGAPVAAVA